MCEHPLPPSFRPLPGGDMEADCIRCGEALLLRDGDEVRTCGREGKLLGVMCERCGERVDYPERFCSTCGRRKTSLGWRGLVCVMCILQESRKENV